jgi:hypothetical protein
MAWVFSAALVEACESLPCSPGPVAASSPGSSAETTPSAPSSGTPTPQAYSSDSKTLATYRRSRYGMTCAPLTAGRGEALLTAFLAASRARTSAWPGAAMASTASAVASGESSRAWFARWDQSGCEWRTAQRSLLGDSESYSATWPRSGLMLAGTCYPLPTAAPRICVSESGSSPGAVFPTPAARDYRHPNAKSFEERGGGKKGEQLPNSVGGPLNPTFVEWLMGWPLGWTAAAAPTESSASEMGKFQSVQQWHGHFLAILHFGIKK